MGASKDKPRKEPEPEEYTINVILVGILVGKTCMSNRFAYNTFVENELTTGPKEYKNAWK